MTEYQVREVPTTPGGDPDLVLPALGATGSGEDESSSQAESSQPSESGGFSGAQHGITGMQYAIEDIQNLEGFQDEYSGLPCGGLVEMEDGPWFLGLYEQKKDDGSYVVCYSLSDLRGNGLPEPIVGELFVPAGGNSGQVGIVQDEEGTYYLMVKNSRMSGAMAVISQAYVPFGENGPVFGDGYSLYGEVDYDGGTETYALDGTVLEEGELSEFQAQFTTLCSMDILGNYTGNVITFEEFLQNYT